MGEAYKVQGVGKEQSILVAKPEVKWPLGRPAHRLDDNIKIYLREMRCNWVDWIFVTEDRAYSRILVNTTVNSFLP
jgi:hypothetical protein